MEKLIPMCLDDVEGGGGEQKKPSALDNSNQSLGEDTETKWNNFLEI